VQGAEEVAPVGIRLGQVETIGRFGREVRPLRQWDDTISKELERICLKALAKRAADRYLTARDLAEDLRCYLAASPVPRHLTLPVPDSNTGTGKGGGTGEESGPVRIVPKGLRSFDAHDADFFLELLPGPRDRAGLPDSIRFWKTRIEQMNADDTFAVGLIYGPSGCGKSSLVKAGLLPRLAKTVTVLYRETTVNENESRLLKGLRRQVPELPDNLSLVDSLAELRRGRRRPGCPWHRRRTRRRWSDADPHFAFRPPRRLPAPATTRRARAVKRQSTAPGPGHSP
jgi:hypothetical protein